MGGIQPIGYGLQQDGINNPQPLDLYERIKSRDVLFALFGGGSIHVWMTVS